MNIDSFRINLSTNGHGDVRDITPDVLDVVMKTGWMNGIVTVFCPSSTSALTTIEFESGCVNDLQRLFDEILDPKNHYVRTTPNGEMETGTLTFEQHY